MDRWSIHAIGLDWIHSKNDDDGMAMGEGNWSFFFPCHAETHTTNLLLTMLPPPSLPPTGRPQPLWGMESYTHSCTSSTPSTPPIWIENCFYRSLFLSVLRSQNIATSHRLADTIAVEIQSGRASSHTPQMHMLGVRLENRVCISTKQ